MGLPPGELFIPSAGGGNEILNLTHILTLLHCASTQSLRFWHNFLLQHAKPILTDTEIWFYVCVQTILSALQLIPKFLII